MTREIVWWNCDQVCRHVGPLFPKRSSILRFEVATEGKMALKDGQVGSEVQLMAVVWRFKREDEALLLENGRNWETRAGRFVMGRRGWGLLLAGGVREEAVSVV